MKIKYLCIVCMFFSIKSYSQFVKNEKLLGGNLTIYTVREKNPGAAAGGPFGSTSAKTNEFSFRPEFNYIISKNVGISVFGELKSLKYSNNPGVSESRSKSFAVGAGLSRYKFFTEGFGILGKVQVSYSPSWSRYYDTTATFYPKEKYYLTNISLLPGVFYRFSRHFSLQATIGQVSYDH